VAGLRATPLARNRAVFSERAVSGIWRITLFTTNLFSEATRASPSPDARRGDSKTWVHKPHTARRGLFLRTGGLFAVGNSLASLQDCGLKTRILESGWRGLSVRPKRLGRLLPSADYPINLLCLDDEFVLLLYLGNMIRPQKPPHQAEPPPAEGEPSLIVACLGSSSTAGKGQAFNWIMELQRRLGERRVTFRNFGVGGDLAYNALQRLSDVVASHPKKIVVFIGGNDVLALVSTKARTFFRISKRLPRDSSAEWFRENLRTIVLRLKAETPAAIALCSLPPIGEDPVSANPFQSELNRRIEEFSDIIRGMARQEGTDYIAIYETIIAEIMKSPQRRAFTGFSFLPFYRDAVRTLVLRKSPDEVARLNSWGFHTDGVHLNSRSGLIVADLVQKFIEK